MLVKTGTAIIIAVANYFKSCTHFGKSRPEIFNEIADRFVKIGPRFPKILASNIIGNRIEISASGRLREAKWAKKFSFCTTHLSAWRLKVYWIGSHFVKLRRTFFSENLGEKINKVQYGLTEKAPNIRILSLPYSENGSTYFGALRAQNLLTMVFRTSVR